MASSRGYITNNNTIIRISSYLFFKNLLKHLYPSSSHRKLSRSCPHKIKVKNFNKKMEKKEHYLFFNLITRKPKHPPF